MVSCMQGRNVPKGRAEGEMTPTPLRRSVCARDWPSRLAVAAGTRACRLPATLRARRSQIFRMVRNFNGLSQFTFFFKNKPLLGKIEAAGTKCDFTALVKSAGQSYLLNRLALYLPDERRAGLAAPLFGESAFESPYSGHGSRGALGPSTGLVSNRRWNAARDGWRS